MKVYAIRHKDSGCYLPAKQPSKAMSSHSSSEPVKNGGRWGPRLFYSLRSAQNSLSAWLQGEHRVHYGQDWDGYGPVEDYGIRVKHRPHRKKEDMEIVEFDLMEVENELYQRVQERDNVQQQAGMD